MNVNVKRNDASIDVNFAMAATRYGGPSCLDCLPHCLYSHIRQRDLEEYSQNMSAAGRLSPAQLTEDFLFRRSYGA